MAALSLSVYLTVLSIALPTSASVWPMSETRPGMNLTTSSRNHSEADEDTAVPVLGLPAFGNLTTSDYLEETDNYTLHLYEWKKRNQTAVEFLLGYCSHRCPLDDSSTDFQGANTPQPLTNAQSMLYFKICGNLVCFDCKCSRVVLAGQGSGRPTSVMVPHIPHSTASHSSNTTPEQEVERTTKDGADDVPAARGMVSDGNKTEQKTDRLCVMGNCCPVRPPSDFQPHDLTNGQYTGCLAGLGHRFLAVVRCPEQHPDPTLRQECEHGKGNFTTDEPVTDLATQVVYRNPHCAKCHGVDRYTPWRLQVDCKHFQYLYTVRSELELLKELRDADTKRHNVCTLHHVPPLHSSPLHCTRFFQRDGPHALGHRVIRSCNVTGLWTELDDDVRSNCAKFTALQFRVRESGLPGRIFINLFCAMCNGVQPKTRVCTISFPQPRLSVGPLRFLLGMQDRHETVTGTVDTCPAGQWLSLDVSMATGLV